MNKIQKIENFGQRYAREFLSPKKAPRNAIYQDWYRGLLFFFSKSFYRGRRDEISKIFEKRTVQTLEEFNLKRNLKIFSSKNFQKLLLNNKVNNQIDRRMVCETIEFIKINKQKNIVRYSVEKIKSDSVGELTQEIKEIHGIADKLTGLYLRDIALVFRLEKVLKDEDLKYFQPIDTWVRQVAVVLRIIDDRENGNEKIKAKIIKECKKNKISSLLFNAGAWYVGKHSFELLFENLKFSPD